MSTRYWVGSDPGGLTDAAPRVPFKAVLIAERLVGIAEREALCKALVESGCLYLMAWGQDAAAWQDAINLANLQAHDFGQIPDKQLVIATSHPNQSLDDVFWFAKNTAMHPCDPLADTLLLHLADREIEEQMLARYHAA